jgi:hypothetical protein
MKRYQFRWTPTEPSTASAPARDSPATDDLGELQLNVLPNHQAAFDASHHSYVAILRNDEAHAIGKFGAVPHHRSMACSVLLIIHFFEENFACPGVARRINLGRIFTLGYLNPKTLHL